MREGIKNHVDVPGVSIFIPMNERTGNAIASPAYGHAATRFRRLSGFTIFLEESSMKKSIVTAAAVLALTAAPFALASGTPAHTTMTSKSSMMAKKRAWAMHHRMWLMKVQRALNKAGAHLKVDGYWGPKTMAAVKEFQMSHGLKATGHLDHATLAKLGLWHKGWMKKKAAKK
jgi:hypothetical protein